MATFTRRLKDVIESVCNTEYDPSAWVQKYDSYTFNSVIYGKLPYIDDYTLIGLGTYPIFDENYRPILNGKIIDEYFNREIGMETIDDFRLALRRKMDQIMPYFNQLYDSQKIPYEALSSMSIHSVGQTHIAGSDESTANSTNDTKSTSASRSVNSDTPQTMLSPDEDYASSAADTNSQSDVNSDGTTTTSSSNNADNDSDTLVTGYQGAASDLIVKYRNSLINIDTMILDQVKDCFMLVLNNGDEYSNNNYYGWW